MDQIWDRKMGENESAWLDIQKDLVTIKQHLIQF